MKSRTAQAVAQASSAAEVSTANTNGAAPFSLPSWPTLFWSASADQRQLWCAQARENHGVVTLEAPAVAKGAGRLPAMNPKVLDLLADASTSPPLKPDLNGSDLSASHLPASQELCVQRLLDCQDIFLLRALPASGLLTVIRETIIRACARGERLLVVSPRPVELSEVLQEVSGSGAAWPVYWPSPQSGDDPLAQVDSYLPQQRALSLQHHLAHQTANQTARRLEGIARLRTWIGEAALWRDRLDLLATARAAQERYRSDLAAVPALLRGDLAAERIDRRLAWHQQWEAEVHRHQTSQRELETALAAADAELATATTELDKWRREVAAQESLMFSQRIPNPFSLKWWRSLFQGRGRERLAEQKARIQDAEILYLSARSHQQLATENLEVETKRHEAAGEQILKAETQRRQQALEAEVNAEGQKIDTLLRDWDQWLRSLGDQAASGRPPTSEEVTQLVDGWQELLRQEEAARLREESGAAPSLPPFAEAQEAVFQVANVVLMPLAALEQADADLQRWLAPGFERTLLLSAPSVAERSITALATHTQALGLVGPLAWGPGPTAPSHFDQLWRQFRPGGEPQTMRWYREGERWHSRWAGLTAELERRVYREPLVDQPEIALFIVEPPGQTPRVAALEFPAQGFSLAQAKQFYASELEEGTIDPAAPNYRAREEGRRLVIEFAATCPEVLEPVPLGPGLVEWLGPQPTPTDAGWQAWATYQLDFATDEGWTWDRVQAWLSEQGVAPEPTRTFELRELTGLPARVAEAISVLEPRLGAQQTPPPSSRPELAAHELCWLRPPPEPAAPPRPKQVLKRLDAGLRSPVSAKEHPAFNVTEARLAVRAAERLLSQLPKDAADLLIHFHARSEPQRQLLEQHWRAADTAQARCRASFGVEGMPPPRADVVICTLWPPVPGTPSPQRLRGHCLELLLAARGAVWFVGDLEHLALPGASTNGAAEPAEKLAALASLLRESPLDPERLGTTA